jgi:hypothetical protein
MTDRKHSPGPWRLDCYGPAQGDYGDIDGSVIDNDQVTVAALSLPWFDGNTDRAIANGLLIAAAPELFEALFSAANRLCALAEFFQSLATVEGDRCAGLVRDAAREAWAALEKAGVMS